MGIIIASVAGLIVGVALGYLLFRYVLKQTYNQSINNAKNEAEAIKSKKLLEVKEKFLNKKFLEYLKKVFKIILKLNILNFAKLLKIIVVIYLFKF